MAFPKQRPRRLRRGEAIRRAVRETEIAPSDLILPIFLIEGTGQREQIEAMPGCFRISADLVVQEAKEAAGLGIPGVLLFGLPERKDPLGTQAYSDDAPVQRGVRAIKESGAEITVITDVCLCQYTNHGHCGRIEGGDVDNDRTLELIAKTALSHTKAGADFVAPSDMMDGRVGAIREALDANGQENVGILSYAAKFASAFYGPFRDAADSAPQFGDRKSYQMDPANAREALREIELDIEEGADIVMVKPALPYLDVIARARERFNVPLAAYQVSGEYSMIKAAGARGWLEETRAASEALLSIKRAGADLIVTYFAKEAARLAREGS